MKKQLATRVRLYGKSLFLITSTVLFLHIGAKAQSTAEQKSPGNGVAITHVQSDEASSLFQVRVPNEEGEKFSLVVRDNEGSVLFSEVYQEKNFDKRFLIRNADKGARLFFVIRSLKDKQTQTFETNAITRVVEDVVITKLD